MKVLLFAFHIGVTDSTGGNRPRAMAKYLPQFGVDVVSVGLAPDADVHYADNAILVPGLTEFHPSRLRYRVSRVVQEAYRRLGCYRPILGDWKSRVSAEFPKIWERHRPDVVLATYPPVEALELGLDFAERYALPFVADFRDGLMFEPLERARLKLSSVKRHYSLLEQRVVHRAQLILGVSEPITDYFRSLESGAQVLTIPNGFDPDDFAGVHPADLGRAPNDIAIVHTGRLSGSEAGRSIAALVSALLAYDDARDTQAPRVCLHLVGDLSRTERLQCDELSRRGLVRFWGAVSRAEALSLQKAADVLLLVVAPGQKSVATGKLFEYLMWDAPILALAEGSAAAAIIARTQSGFVAPPDDAVKIGAVLTGIVSRHKLGRRLGKRLDEVAVFSRRFQMERLGDALLSLRRL